MKFFSVDSPLYRFLSRVLDILKLNFLWILGSLPVFTIGASTTAAMSVALKLADDEEGYITKSYFEAYKANFKQGVPMGLIFLVAWYAVYLDFQLFGAVKNNPALKQVLTYPAAETIRATVVGAGTHTTNVSGSTISYSDGQLPIKNSGPHDPEFYGYFKKIFWKNTDPCDPRRSRSADLPV